LILYLAGSAGWSSAFRRNVRRSFLLAQEFVCIIGNRPALLLHRPGDHHVEFAATPASA
jgi:hypothetical protein